MPRLRLIPLTVVVAFLTLGIKLGEVVRDGKLYYSSLVNTAQAADAAKPEEGAKPAGGEAAKPADPNAKPDEKAAGEKPKDEKDAKEGKEAKDPEEIPGDNEEKRKKREYSQIEVDLLQSLAQRRQELDGWAKQVQLKENMLIATEKRINEKVDNLQRMKKDIEDLLALYNEQEDTKIRSLVKIYENMKPKDAARIFEELDMPVLLLVVDKMSERKVSPVLANMSPQKAKDLTVQLAEQRKLQKPRANAAAASAADANAPATGAEGAPAANSGGTGGAAPAATPPAEGAAGAGASGGAAGGANPAPAGEAGAGAQPQGGSTTPAEGSAGGAEKK